MRKTLVVAVREYQAAVRTRTFIISLVFMPLMASAGLIVTLLFSGHVDLGDQRYAVVDPTGALFEDLKRAAESHNQDDIFKVRTESREQKSPRFILEPVSLDSTLPKNDKTDSAEHEASGGLSPELDALLSKLSDRVRKGDLRGFVVIDPRVLSYPERSEIAIAGESTPVAVYHSSNPMRSEFRNWFEAALNDFVLQRRASAAGLDTSDVKWVAQRLEVANEPLWVAGVGAAPSEARKDIQFAHAAAGVGMSLLMFMVILVGAMPLTYSVLEEKTQRSAEVLLGSITPFEFMMGKLLGMVGVSLSIVTIYLVVGFIGGVGMGYGASFPRHLLLWFIVFQASAILMYGSMFAAIGAACNDMKDAQNLMTPASVVACIPLFVIRPVMLDPNSTLSTLLAFFPPATPILMLLRQAMPTPIPAWQPAAGVVISLATSIGCVWIAGRVFRVGILMQGKGASLLQIARWALRREERHAVTPERRHATA